MNKKAAGKNRFAPGEKTLRDLEHSGFIHRPLPLHRENALESLGWEKRVLKRRLIPDRESPSRWEKRGEGSLTHDGRQTPEGHTALKMELPTVTDHWPCEAKDGDYTPFCRLQARYDVGGENWEAYNRISFRIYPDCGGARTVNIALIFANDGTEKIPDPYNREGRHEVNLINRQWNECFLEIPELPRDRIRMIGFESAAYGRDRSTGETLRFDIGELYLEEVEAPETVRGWLPGEGRVSYSMSGYEMLGTKTALLRASGNEPPVFTLRNAYGMKFLAKLRGIHEKENKHRTSVNFIHRNG
jgi:hypothetical protein